MATTNLAMTTVAVLQLLEEHARKLKLMELKYELKKRGEGTGVNTKILFDPLIEYIQDKTPFGKTADRPRCMNGLDIIARWVPLTQNVLLIPDPVNKDANLRPTTERDAPINPKYGFDEKFERQTFEETMGKLSYRRTRWKKRVEKLSPTRMMPPHKNLDLLPKAEPRVEMVRIKSSWRSIISTITAILYIGLCR